MNALARQISEGEETWFSLRAFLAGLAGWSLLVLIVAGWLWWEESTQTEDSFPVLASVTVDIQDSGEPVHERAHTAPSQDHHETESHDSSHKTEEDEHSSGHGADHGAKSVHNEHETDHKGHDQSEEHASHAPEQNHETASHEEEDASGHVAREIVLPEAPISGLYEKTPTGFLPLIRKSDGLTPYQAYRRPVPPAHGDHKPLDIALVLSDFGLSHRASESAVRALPPEITLALSSYSDNPQGWVSLARKSGHEVWMTVPMEPELFLQDDTGPETLMVRASAEKNEQILYRTLGKATGYAGVIASPDSVFVRSQRDISFVLDTLYARGLGFADSSQDPSLVPQAVAHKRGGPYAANDGWVDSDPDKTAIQKQLEALEAKARESGRAVGFFHPWPVSYLEILDWSKTLEKRGIRLVPLSAVSGGLEGAPDVASLLGQSESESGKEHDESAHGGHEPEHTPPAHGHDSHDPHH